MTVLKPSLAAAIIRKLADEWCVIDPDRPVEPSNITADGRLVVWWQCEIDQAHSYEASVYDRAHGGAGCPYCQQQKH